MTMNHHAGFDIDRFNINLPAPLPALLADSESTGFDMCSATKTGQLLRFLAATKPCGNFLEIGTGTGVGAAWLLAGMGPNSNLTTIEQDLPPLNIARKHLSDPRIHFINEDAAGFIRHAEPESYDLIFADAVPGKYELVEDTLALLVPGGVYVIDDMLPQPDWPEEHYPFAAEMLDQMSEVVTNDPSIVTAGLDWDTGIMLLTKTGGPQA